MALQNSEVETRTASGDESVAPFSLEDVNEAIIATYEEEFHDLVEDGYLSIRRWAAQWGVAERTVRRKMALLLKAGLADIRETTAINLAGQRYMKPVYKILIKKEG